MLGNGRYREVLILGLLGACGAGVGIAGGLLHGTPPPAEVSPMDRSPIAEIWPAGSHVVTPRDTPSGSVVAVILRANDTDTCEDLGRQLRELRRAVGTAARFELWTDSAEVDLLRRFATVERLLVAAIRPMELQHADGERAKRLVTPAAVVISERAEVLGGVSHPILFAGTRIQSFASELEVPLQRLRAASR